METNKPLDRLEACPSRAEMNKRTAQALRMRVFWGSPMKTWGVWCERSGVGFWHSHGGGSGDYETSRAEAERIAASLNEFSAERGDSIGWRYEARPYCGVTKTRGVRRAVKRVVLFPVQVVAGAFAILAWVLVWPRKDDDQ